LAGVISFFTSGAGVLIEKIGMKPELAYISVAPAVFKTFVRNNDF